MKLLIVTPIFPPEGRGPATYTSELVRKLASKKISSRVVTFTQNPTKIDSVPIYSIPIEGGLILRQGRLIKKILDWGKNSDVIYAQGADVVGLASVLAGKMLHKKVVIKFVGDLSIEMERDFHRKGFLIRWLYIVTKITLSLTDEIIFPAKHLQETICTKYKIDKKKTNVIYNAVDD